MPALESLETKLTDILDKKAPIQLSDKSRKTIVEYLPWINLVFGLIVLMTARALWHWAHLAQAAQDEINKLYQSYGGKPIIAHRMTVVVWLGLIMLIVEGVLLLAAFPSTRQRQKRGWDLLFYAALVNIMYGAVMLFSEYGGFLLLILSFLAGLVGLYFLFQVRSYYLGRKANLTTTIAKESA